MAPEKDDDLPTRTMARLQEVAEARGFADGYEYEGPSLSRDSRASAKHTQEAQAVAAKLAGSSTIPPPARPTAYKAAKAFYRNAFMRGRIARSTLPPLDLPPEGGALPDGMAMVERDRNDPDSN